MRNFSIQDKTWQKSWDRNLASASALAEELNMSHSLAWERIFSEIKAHFGSMQRLRVIEIGAGLGRASAKLAREGADVTLIDFSSLAISKARDFFREAGLSADFLVCDVFNLPENLKNGYDVSISFGLVEHFKENERQNIFSIHAGLIREGGMGIVGTPNTYGFPYILWMFLAKSLGLWEVGYERPYTHREIRAIMRGLGYNYRHWGTPFSETINTYVINKLNILLTNLIFLRRLKARDKRKKVYRFIPYLKDRWSVLDDLCGYHMVFFINKCNLNLSKTEDLFL